MIWGCSIQNRFTSPGGFSKLHLLNFSSFMYGGSFGVCTGRDAVALGVRLNANAVSNGGVKGGVVVAGDGIVTSDAWVVVRLLVGLSDSFFPAMQSGFQQQRSLPFPIENEHTIPWIFSSQYVHCVDNE